jgi:hypothetical protein
MLAGLFRCSRDRRVSARHQTGPMATRQGPMRRGSERGRAIVNDLCREAESARLAHGTSYAELGRALHLGGGQVAAICRGRSPDVSILRMSQVLSVVGLDLSARAYPAGPAVRDAGQLRLLARLQARLHPSLGWRLEVPVVELPVAGVPDLRAWDAAIEGDGWLVGVDAESHIGDLQAVIRRVMLKVRDSVAASGVLLLSETRHHRRLLAEAGPGLIATFPVGPRRALGALLAGGSPDGNALILL